MPSSRPAAPTRPRVAVVDGCSLTRAAFQQVYPALEVVSTHTAIDGLLRRPVPVDLVVLDLTLATAAPPGGVVQGPAAVRALVQHGYRVCVHTGERRPLVLAQCLANGATGIVSRFDSLDANQRLLLAVARGCLRLAPDLREPIEAIQRRGGPPVLTLRQRQVLHARARGTSWRSISDDLGISAKTAYDRLEAVRLRLSGFLDIAGLSPDAPPADLERAIAHTPSDLLDPGPVR